MSNTDGDFLWNFITGVLIGFVLLGAFKLAWFLFRIVWYLTIFLVLSVGAGSVFLVRRTRRRSDANWAGFGEYSPDHARWHQASGESFACDLTDRLYSEVQAARVNMYWRATALSRLFRRGAVDRNRFSAVTQLTSAPPEVVAKVDFGTEARHGITLDHLDPAVASGDPYDLARDRENAKAALGVLDSLMVNKGWERVGRSEEHWYAYQYARPVMTMLPEGEPSDCATQVRDERASEDSRPPTLQS